MVPTEAKQQLKTEASNKHGSASTAGEEEDLAGGARKGKIDWRKEEEVK
jgi:hypothetical protein